MRVASCLHLTQVNAHSEITLEGRESFAGANFDDLRYLGSASTFAVLLDVTGAFYQFSRRAIKLELYRRFSLQCKKVSNAAAFLFFCVSRRINDYVNSDFKR